MAALDDSGTDSWQWPSGATERRQYKRVAVEIPGKVFVPSSAKEGACTIYNVSPAGAELACGLEGLLDTPIVLYAAGLGRFEGHVVWEYAGRYGMKFNASELKRAKLANHLAADVSEQRGRKRTKVNVGAHFTREDGSIVSCVVLDFSTSGVFVRSVVRPRVGEYVLIAGMVGCIVRYDDAGVGIEFVGREQDENKFRESLASLDRWRYE